MKHKLAFTLIELLVVISVIGILIATVTLSFSGAQRKARDARRIEDMNSIQKAMEMYYGANNYVYPSDESVLTSSGYLQTVPSDPKPSPYLDYKFGYPTPGSTYCVCADVENQNEGNSNSRDCQLTFSDTGTYYCVKNRQ